MRRLLTLAVVGLIVAGMFALSSGRVAYVSTSGVSMEPTYSAGDLVLVVRDEAYGVGDAVAYPDPGTGKTVLHRIIDGDGTDGFVLQGDNNSSIDPHEPTASEIIGRAVGHVPALGGILASPVTRGVLALVVAGLLGSLAVPSRKQTAMSEPAAAKTATQHRPGSRVRTMWLAMVALDVVLLAGVVAAFALRPASSEAPAEAEPVEQAVQLGYTADTPKSETYPEGRVETGETVFRSLVRSVDVFARTAADVPVDGHARLDLTVTSSAGWERTMSLVDRTSLDGDDELAAAITFAEIDALAERIAAETGVNAGTLDLAVTLTGEAAVDGGEPVELDATLPLRLGPQTLTLADAETTDTDDGPVVATSAELPAAPVDGQPAPVDEGTDLTRPAIVALLLGLGITAVLWPSGHDEDEQVVHVHTTDLYHPLSATSVEVADAGAVEGIAARAHAPVLERDDGWLGVVAGDVLYWSGPARHDPHAAGRAATDGGEAQATPAEQPAVDQAELARLADVDDTPVEARTAIPLTSHAGD